MKFVFSTESTILFYLSVFLLGIILLFIADHSSNIILKKACILTVSIAIYFIVAYRTVGIDRDTYVEMYELTPYYVKSGLGLLTMEPLYFLLNIVAYYVFKNFIFVQCFQGAIYAFAIYHFLKKCELQKKSLVNIYSFLILTSFFYMMGLNRMCISASLFLLAFISYEKAGSTFKTIVLCILSVLFHYGAIIITVPFVYYFIINKKSYKKLGLLFGTIVSFGTYFLIIGVVPFLLRAFSQTKYFGYINNFAFSFENIKSVIYFLPLFLLYFIFDWNKKIVNEHEKKIISYCFLIFMFSIMFLGAYRFGLYITPVVASTYDDYFKRICYKPKGSEYFINTIFIAVLIVYCYMVYFDSVFITDHILPYGFSI